jgi:hypothetical protein
VLDLDAVTGIPQKLRAPARSSYPWCALAVHDARTVGEPARVSQASQAALLPRALPQVPQIEFAPEYLPASTGAEVGGDFYDAVAVGYEKWLVTIGDAAARAPAPQPAPAWSATCCGFSCARVAHWFGRSRYSTT